MQTTKIVRRPRGRSTAHPLAPRSPGLGAQPGEAERRRAGPSGSRHHYGVPAGPGVGPGDGAAVPGQTRPITTCRGHGPTATPGDGQPGRPPTAPVLRGLAASPGRATGRVRVLHSPRRAAPAQRRGPRRPDQPGLDADVRRAAALVTDTRRHTCHAAIVARELGVPAVVGTRSGTPDLLRRRRGHRRRDHRQVWPASSTRRPRRLPPGGPGARHAPRSGGRGHRDRGVRQPRRRRAGRRWRRCRSTASGCCARNCCSPRRCGTASVGPDRRRGAEQVVTDLAASVGDIAGPSTPRPVVYRAADLRSNEFRGLAGGDEYEPVEDNPMIGYRGCYRYVHDPSFFRLELAALAGSARSSPACPHDPVRPDPVGAGGLPRPGRRLTPGPPARPAPLGDGGGPLGGLLAARTSASAWTACRSAATTSRSWFSASTGTPMTCRAVRRGRPAVLAVIDQVIATARGWGSRRRCAARRPPGGRVRRAPGARRHHLGLRRAHRRVRDALGTRRRRASSAARAPAAGLGRSLTRHRP